MSTIPGSLFIALKNVLEITGSIRPASELKNISTIISHYNILGKDTGKAV